MENVFNTEVAELATVVVASARSELFNEAPAAANESVPAPSVLKNYPLDPYEVGKVIQLMVTLPVTTPDN